MQVVLLCLQQFCRNSLLKCVLAQKCQKVNQILYFEGSRSFKVINVDTPIKLARSLLRQAASLSLSAMLFTLDKPTAVK